MSSQDISINIDICRDFRTEIMQFDKDCFDLCVELDYTEAQLNDRSDEDEGYSAKLSISILNLKTTVENIQASGVQPPRNISNEPNSSSGRCFLI